MVLDTVNDKFTLHSCAQRSAARWKHTGSKRVGKELLQTQDSAKRRGKKFAIVTAYIISPLRGKGSTSSNSSVMYLCTSGVMHCDRRFKYPNFSRLVVMSTEFVEVVVKVPPLPPPLVAVDPVSYIYMSLALAVAVILP